MPDCYVELIDRLEEALEGLLGGLDANGEDCAGLSDEQWDVRIANARNALAEIEADDGTEVKP